MLHTIIYLVGTSVLLTCFFFLSLLEFGSLTSLVTLRLDENDLSGYLPTEIGLMGESLNVLDISMNHPINGSIPSEIGMLKGLSHFFAYQTHIHGAVPMEVAGLATNGNLDHFHMQETLLYGTIPQEMCSIELITFDCGTHLCGCDCSCGHQHVTLSVNCAETPEKC